MARIIKSTIFMAAMAFTPPQALHAGESWDDIRAIAFGEHHIEAAPDSAIALHAPYRASDDRRVPISAEVSLGQGQMIRKVYLVIDENPMPVSAVFEMERPTSHFDFGLTMRINGPGGIHLVVETTDGKLIEREGYIKTSGLGACAAPPGTDPVMALKTLGQMKLALAPAHREGMEKRLARLASASPSEPIPVRAESSFRHPSLSGLQMDQVTLLYIPARFIETVKFATDDQPFFTMTGSISLSEDPALSVVLPKGASVLKVNMTDTEGAAFEKTFPLIQG